MILRFYPKKDATVYEYYPEKNTGLDAMLDISKTIVGSSSFNSRALIDFDYSSISSSVARLGYDPNKCKYNLKLYIADAQQIPIDYSLYCYGIANSWDMGVGRFGNIPETTDGVSWYYREAAANPATAWPTMSFGIGATGSWSVRPGGGTWFTGSVASQSFNYTTSDVSLDVTQIINEVQSGSITFNGFLIKKSDADEVSDKIFNSLKFFSKDTHTIYLPVLEVKYDDSTTGSLAVIDQTEDFNVVLINLKPTYVESSTPTIRLSARPRYPIQTFTTSSVYLTRYALPSNTTYAIKNAHTDDVVVNFDDDYTKISGDGTSNFIKLHLDSFQPERYYRLLLKVPNSDGNSFEIYDQNWIFKVTRS